MLRVLSLMLAAIPFAFGIIRLRTTGNDWRYVVVALAGLAASIVIPAVLQRSLRHPIAAGLAVFVGSTAAAIAAAMFQGTTLNPGLIVVAVAFGACFAASAVCYQTAGRLR